MKKNYISYFFTAPYMILFTVFTILPVVIAIFLSFTQFNLLETPKFVGLSNYTRMFFEDSVFLKGFQNTLLLAVIIGPGGYILSLLFAWFICELNPILRTMLTVLFYAPSISGNVYLIWTVFFSSDDYGYANSLLTKMGFIQEPILWLQNPEYILLIVIIVAMWTSLGTGFLTFVASFQGIDKSYYEAGAIDGITNRWQELWFITLPLIKSQMMFSAVMSITGSFSVGTIVTALCGYPTTDYSGHTIMTHLTDYGTTRYEMGYACAIATVLFIMMVGFNSVVKKFLSKVGE